MLSSGPGECERDNWAIDRGAGKGGHAAGRKIHQSWCGGGADPTSSTSDSGKRSVRGLRRIGDRIENDVRAALRFFGQSDVTSVTGKIERGMEWSLFCFAVAKDNFMFA